MKKYLSILLTFITVVLVLASCGDNSNNASSAESSTDTSQSNSAKPSESAVSVASESSSDTGEENVLNLYTWEGMFPTDVLSDFESETGIKINYVNFDFDESMLAKLQTEKGGAYDVIIADDYIIELAIKENLVRKLDKDKLTNFKHINSLYQNQFFDPDNSHTVPYGSGVQTIVYDPAVVEKEITSYADLWDSSLTDSIGVVANARVINGMALKVMGESYNTEDISKIEAAGQKLTELAPNIRLIKDDNIQDDLISGEISAAVMYTSQATMAKMANPELKIIFPTEGIGFGVMANFIPINAPHPDAAYRFIDYILRPEVSAKCFEALGYYSTNKAADALLSDDIKDLLTLPAEFKAEDMEMIGNVNATAIEAHEKAWTAFKTAAGQ